MIFPTNTSSSPSPSLGPYSNFRVGAAVLLTNSDTIYTGANVENAAYPVGICAERVALGTAVAAGVRPGGIRAVAVASDLPGAGKNNNTSTTTTASSSASSFCSPCGMCRQFLAEFCAATVPVIMFDADGSQMVMTVGEVSYAAHVMMVLCCRCLSWEKKIALMIVVPESSSILMYP